MTHHTNTRTLTLQTQALTNQLAHIAITIAPTITRALDWTPAGQSTSTGPNVQGGDTRDLSDKIIDNKTEQLKTRKDKTTITIKAIIHDIQTIQHTVQRLQATLKQLQPIDHPTAQQLAEQTQPNTGTECANPNCRTWITGKGNDRPRAGRCPACYQHRHRTGHERPATVSNPPGGTP